MIMWDAFMNLGIRDRLIMIALYIIGVLLLILWARFITKRLPGGVLIKLFNRVIATSPKQEMENLKNKSATTHKSEEIQKRLKKTIVWEQLLSNFCNSVRNGIFCYIPKDERNNQKPHISIIRFLHINRILARKRYVNQERQEPKISCGYYKM
jgi:hypothetical protein